MFATDYCKIAEYYNNLLLKLYKNAFCYHARSLLTKHKDLWVSVLKLQTKMH